MRTTGRSLMTVGLLATACAGGSGGAERPRAAPQGGSRPLATNAPGATGELPPPLPPASALRTSGGDGPPVASYRREEDIVFRPRGGAATVRLIERSRSNAWLGPNGVVVTSGGSSGSLLAGGKTQKLAIADGFEVSFSPDGTQASVVQARAPLSVISIPQGKVVWEHEHGLGCAARWASPTTLVAHDDLNEAFLWRIDLSLHPPRAQKLGVERRADHCWASADGKRWLVQDDFARKERSPKGSEHYRGVLWRVDGETGAATVLLEDPSDIVASSAADRVCYTKKDGIFCRAVDGPDERVADEGAYLQLDDTGRTLVFSTRGVFFAADLNTKTVRALSGVTGHSGGIVAVLSGGEAFATGSSSGVEVFDLRAKTKLVIPGGSFYGVHPVPGRARSLFIEKEQSNNVVEDLYLAELPP